MFMYVYFFSGRPSPSVIWLRDGAVIDDTFQIRSGGSVKNDLLLRGFSREDLDSQLSCQAFNNNLTAPKVRSVQIDLNRK